MLLAAEWSTHAEPAVVASDRVNGDSDVGTLRNKVIGSIGVAALVAGSLIAAPIAQAAEVETIQVLGTNDFHGRIALEGAQAGAAVMAGAVKQLRTQYPDTVFAAAGDLIGASTFESFIAHDKPTIDALNSAGLEVSAVGNHEFDQGYDDLVDRVMAPYDAVTNPFGGAAWRYLGANVRNSDDSAALPESWIQDFGDVQVGFVGAVTDNLPELVSPGGIVGLKIEKEALAANRTADQLKSQGADLVVLLVHEGATTTALSSATDPTSDFGQIVNGVNANIDAIISGHTHLAYNHSIPVQQWIDEGRAVTSRPVVSAGQYGTNLNQLLFTVSVDGANVSLTGVTQNLLPLMGPLPTTPVTYTPNYPSDAQTAAIVTTAVADAEGLGAVTLGRIAAPFNRAKLGNGTTENRGGESTLGNLVAEVQQTATESPEAGAAQIAFMNPGGLRQDMVGNAGTPATYPADLTYKQAAVVQPFANTLVNMKMTRAQIQAALEQQWQPAGSARPFLRLGISEGFSYTYDPAAVGSRITQMWLNGTPLDPTMTYSVTVNSFLATGGDNFGAFATGTNKRDTGQVDLDAMVEYMDPYDEESLAVDYTQRSVGVTFPAGAPAEYATGDEVAFNLSSLAFSTAADQKDAEVSVAIGDVQVGTFPVDNAIGTDVIDEYGKAAVAFDLPAGVESGSQEVTITGTTTGTTTIVPITVAVPAPTTTVVLTSSAASQIYGSPNTVTLTATVTSSDSAPVTGTVDFVSGSQTLGSATVSNGQATYTLPSDTPAGDYSVVAKYSGSTETPAADSAAVAVTVNKATSTAILLATKTQYRQNPFLPALLFGAVVLNNGQPAKGNVLIKQDGVVVKTVPLTSGIFIWVVPRNLPKDTYEFVATYDPADDNNVSGVDSNGIFIQVR